jgi:hypothetical protein
MAGVVVDSTALKYPAYMNPQENLWDQIQYALKSMSDVNAKLDEAAVYIQRDPTLVKSITSFPYMAMSY